jgi:hypothetical protein
MEAPIAECPAQLLNRGLGDRLHVAHPGQARAQGVGERELAAAFGQLLADPGPVVAINPPHGPPGLLSAPWGLSLLATPRLPVVPRRHRQWPIPRQPGRAAERLASGELALVPRGTGLRLRSEPEAPAPDILSLEREQASDRYELLHHGAEARRPR